MKTSTKWMLFHNFRLFVLTIYSFAAVRFVWTAMETYLIAPWNSALAGRGYQWHNWQHLLTNFVWIDMLLFGALIAFAYFVYVFKNPYELENEVVVKQGVWVNRYFITVGGVLGIFSALYMTIGKIYGGYQPLPLFVSLTVLSYVTLYVIYLIWKHDSELGKKYFNSKKFI